MKEKKTLENMEVTLYMDGGWEVSGKVEKVDPDKFIIESNGSLVMAFRDKISCLAVSEGQRAAKPGPAVQFQQKKDEQPEDLEGPFPMNGLMYDETSMSIPATLLGKSRAQFDSDDDLSVFYPGGSGISDSKDGSSSNISFGIEDDSEE